MLRILELCDTRMLPSLILPSSSRSNLKLLSLRLLKLPSAIGSSDWSRDAPSLALESSLQPIAERMQFSEASLNSLSLKYGTTIAGRSFKLPDTVRLRGLLPSEMLISLVF
jgi:hypothetical protein